MMRLIDTARLRPSAAVLVLVAAFAGALAGAVSARSTGLAFAVVTGLLLVALTAYRPVGLAVLALIGVFASWRVGGTALVPGNKAGVSYSDVLLTGAAFLSIPALLGTQHLRRLRLAGWGVAIYLACLLPTVLLNSSMRGYLEWLHRLVLLGGALCVGAWIAREGKIRPALRSLTIVGCILAVATVANAVRLGWADSAPFGLNKNFIGGQLGVLLILTFIAREHLAVRTPWWIAAVCIVGAGVIASHSRGGALTASVGLFLGFVLTGRLHRPSTKWFAVFVAAVLGVFVYTTVSHQLDHSQTVVGNSSIGVRFNVEHVTRRIWRTSPIYGVGLKYFNTHAFGRFAVAANNVVDNELAESGVIGLAGFVVLQGAALTAALRRARTDHLAAAGFGMVAGLLAHGMVDIYWTAGTVALPFIVMGMALAHEPSDQAQQRAGRRSRAHTPDRLSTAARSG